MHRKCLVATVAAAPLLLLAQAAWAETQIDTAVTAQVKTSDTNDDVTVTSAGSIKPTTAGPALVMDTDNDITNEGTISTNNVDDSTGMAALGGLSGDVTNSGSIQMLEDYVAEDTDDDGILDGPFAEGTDRYGIKVSGAGGLTGSILNDKGASISVEGNNSAGISLETGLLGSLTNGGSISVIGDDGYGIHTIDEVVGDVTLNGSISARGENSEGASIEGDVGGALTIQGGILATGYRFTQRPQAAEDRALLDEDDLLIGGPAVRIGGDVADGVFIDIRPQDLDPDNDDEDNDGIPDAEEGNGAITSYGTAPALLIGSDTRTVAIGVVGMDDDAYGLISKGTITSDGLFDGMDSVGIQVGGTDGWENRIDGGMRLDGSVTTRAFLANTTGIHFTDGATLTGTGEIWNTGTISSQLLGASTILLLEPEFNATAIQIDLGATVPTIRNDGTILAGVFGENDNATALRDESGTLTTVTNTGKIQAVITPTDDEFDLDDEDVNPNNETINGRKIAIDVAANTSGVTITQYGVDDGDDDGDPDTVDPDDDGDGVDNADEPQIFGDILFGSGADTLALQNGSMSGDVSFGDGADTFSVTGGAIYVGTITDTDGLLDINVADGQLTNMGTGTIEATSLDVGADGTLIVSLDAAGEAATRFNVTTADFADGSKIGVRVDGLLTFADLNETRDFVIVDADTLTAGDIDQSLLTGAPYIYNVGITADETAGEVSLAVRRRTAAEIGLNASETAAFDAVYLALGEDEGVRDAFLARFNRKDFLQLYDQMLPDQGEGLFSALDYANVSIARAVANRPDPRQRYGPDSFWIQELNLQVDRSGGETLGSETKGFGFVGGYEAMDDKGGALGLTLAYINGEENDDAAQVGEQTTVALVEGGAYWRRASGAWLFSVRGGAGYALFKGTRRFVAPAEQTIRTADAEWNGFTASASGYAAYERRFGRYYVRPELSVDYFYLSEGDRDESGWDELNQHVADRTSSRLSATGDVTVGAEFGRDFWWRPEVKVGFRQILAGEIGDTTFNFPGGAPVTLAAMSSEDGAAIVGLAIKAGTPMSYLAAELEMERVRNEQRYKALLSGRVMF